MRTCSFALLALSPVAMSACHAQPAPAPARSYETGQLTIGGETFLASEVADARAMPDINKRVGIMLSMTSDGAKRLEAISGAHIGKPLPVVLDGTTLGAEAVRKPITDGVIELPGRWSLDEAETLARRISGRDPLPDDLEME